MTTSKITFSAYKIYWAEFTPAVGKYVTRADIVKIKGYDDGCIGRYNTYFRKHFPNKAAALEFVKSFNKKLSKRYAVRLFTDKQFGMITRGNDSVPYTQKQLAEVYYIG